MQEKVKRHALRGILVGPDGATVDTNGRTGNYSGIPFDAPTNGVVSALADFEPFRWSYVTAPVVEISGDGEGAVAYADFDSKTRMVRGVRIVSGGTGYSYAMARFYYRAYSAKTCTCTVTAPVSGSFTKAGEGDFTFKAKNTYGGKTVLAGGTLVLGVPDALPATTALVPKGGVLAATAENFPSALTVDVSGLDPDAGSRVFARITSGTPAAEPKFTIAGSDDPNWRVLARNGVYKVCYRRGLVLFVK